jgi:hypothetical protein
MTGHPAGQPCNINQAKLPAIKTYFRPAKVVLDIERAGQGINNARIARLSECRNLRQFQAVQGSGSDQGNSQATFPAIYKRVSCPPRLPAIGSYISATRTGIGATGYGRKPSGHFGLAGNLGSDQRTLALQLLSQPLHETGTELEALAVHFRRCCFGCCWRS